MKDSVKEAVLLNYQNMLERIQNQESHLLLANGFNMSFGVNTSYSNIFKKMLEKEHGVYKDAQKLVEKYNYDLESFIRELVKDIDPNNTFLQKFVSNKIKLDFMQATHEIVKSAIKNVYAEENEGIFLLLKNFTNYFSLNYDPFLYLLLLNFKSNITEKETTIAFQPTLKLIEEDMNQQKNNIYTEIKHARENGKLDISGVDAGKSTTSSCRHLTKSLFTSVITEYSKKNSKGWKTKDINKVVDILLEEEKKNTVLSKVDDGCREPSLFGHVFDTASTTQNLFFLHGAFHIYKDKDHEIKITQQTDKALYERLEEILNSDEHDIVCIFQSDNKKDAIDESAYLQHCFNKLKNLSGNMVIIGSSMADNDNHIFEQINNSAVDTIYISTMPTEKEKIYTKAMEVFPEKSVFVFDAETISYKLPDVL